MDTKEAMMEVLETEEDIYLPTLSRKQQENLRVQCFWQRGKLPPSIQRKIGITKVEIEGTALVKLYFRKGAGAFRMKDGKLTPVLEEEQMEEIEKFSEKELERAVRYMRKEGRGEEEIETYIKEYNEAKELTNLEGE